MAEAGDTDPTSLARRLNLTIPLGVFPRGLSIRELTCPVRCCTRCDLGLAVKMAQAICVDDESASAGRGAEPTSKAEHWRDDLRPVDELEDVILPAPPRFDAVL
jgi:hypothetical protein